MSDDSPCRALPEILAPAGFAALIPSEPEAFGQVEQLHLGRPDAASAATVLEARRRHREGGVGWLLLDLPHGTTAAPSIRATSMSVAARGEQMVRITVEIGEREDADRPAGGRGPDVEIDHWSLDLDHDGLAHRAMVSGDGAPPSSVVGEADMQDADRRITLRIVNRRGEVSSAEATIPAQRW